MAGFSGLPRAPSPWGIQGRRHRLARLVFLRLMTPLPDGRVRFFPSTLLLRPGAEPPLVVEHSREVLLRGWRRSELESVLAGVGFATERVLGDFAGAAFDPATSQDLVLVARRSATSGSVRAAG